VRISLSRSECESESLQCDTGLVESGKVDRVSSLVFCLVCSERRRMQRNSLSGEQQFSKTSQGGLLRRENLEEGSKL